MQETYEDKRFYNTSKSLHEQVGKFDVRLTVGIGEGDLRRRERERERWRGEREHACYRAQHKMIMGQFTLS